MCITCVMLCFMCITHINHTHVIHVFNDKMKPTHYLNNMLRIRLYNIRKYDITEARKKLHWFQIEASIDFKLIVLTWKVLNNI